MDEVLLDIGCGSSSPRLSLGQPRGQGEQEGARGARHTDFTDQITQGFERHVNTLYPQAHRDEWLRP